MLRDREGRRRRALANGDMCCEESMPFRDTYVLLEVSLSLPPLSLSLSVSVVEIREYCQKI